MLMEYEDQIAAAKVEFAPYRGWVVVLFPKKGADLSFLGDRVEIRSGDFVPSASPAPVRTSSGATAAKLSAGQPVVIPAGGRMTVTKDVLDNEYKSKMGKFPDRNIKKADLAKLLDELEATGT